MAVSSKKEKGIIGPIRLYSIYLRIWIGKTAFKLDLKEGLKRVKKSSKEFKIILGVVSF
jgi:hypothetical protein